MWINEWTPSSVGKGVHAKALVPKVMSSTPLETKTYFLSLICFIFLSNFINLFHLSKLLILRWFFAHLSFNMSILWLCKKIPKIFYFWSFFIYLKTSHFYDFLKPFSRVFLFKSSWLILFGLIKSFSKQWASLFEL